MIDFVLNDKQRENPSLYWWSAMAFGTSILTIIPQLMPLGLWLNPVIPIVCYGPFLLFLLKQNMRGAFLLGGVQGILLVLIASSWVWTYPDLPKTVMLIVVILAAIIVGSGTLLACFIKKKLSLHALISLPLYSLVIVLFEYGRSVSPHLFLPLGSIAQSSAYPIFLPLTACFGIVGISFFILMVNIAIYLLFLPTLVKLADTSVKVNRIRQYSSILCCLLGVILLLSHLLVKNKESTGPIFLSEGNTLCAVSDLARRERTNNGYLSSSQLKSIVNHAKKELACDVIVFPEYTAQAINKPKMDFPQAAQSSPSVILGVLMGESMKDGMLHINGISTNSTCLAEKLIGDLQCLAKTDKQYLAPFVESNLFHGSDIFRSLGQKISHWFNIQLNSTTTESAGTSLPLSTQGRFRVAVITCLELFIPDLSRRIVAGEESIDFIIAPTDLSAFKASKIILSQYKRAAALQAAGSQKYLLFVSTEDVTLYSPTGKSISPNSEAGEIYAWSK